MSLKLLMNANHAMDNPGIMMIIALGRGISPRQCLVMKLLWEDVICLPQSTLSSSLQHVQHNKWVQMHVCGTIVNSCLLISIYASKSDQ